MSLRRAALWSLLDQALLSGLHFAVGLVVLRLSSKEAYGAYVIGWSVLLLLIGLQNAFINTQMALRAAGLSRSEQRPIFAQFLAAQALLYAPLATVLLGVAAALALLWPQWRQTAAGAAGVILAFAGVSLREFVRSCMLVCLDARRVLLVDAVYSAVLAVLVGGLVLLAPRAQIYLGVILSLGLASAAAVLMWILEILRSTPTLRSGIDALRETRRNGLWSAGGVAVTHFQAQSYVYVLGIVSGLATTAEATAARLMLMPLSLASTSVQRVLYPRWITLVRAGNHTEVAAMARKVVTLFSIGIVLYVVPLMLGAGWLTSALLGPGYQANPAYLLAFAALTWSEAVRTSVSSQLQAYARFRDITLANAITVVPVIALALLLLQAFGPWAAVWAQIIGDLALSLLLHTLTRHIGAQRKNIAAAERP